MLIEREMNDALRDTLSLVAPFICTTEGAICSSRKWSRTVLRVAGVHAEKAEAWVKPVDGVSGLQIA